MIKKLFDCCKVNDNNKQNCCNNHNGKNNNPIYAFGIFGSLVYFWHTSDPTFFDKISSIIKALFWPGFLVYELLKFIGS